MIKNIFIQCIFLTQINAQTILYHEYEPTASDFQIIKWSISKDNLPKLYLIEKVDENGRVTELNFMDNGKFLSPSLCDLPTRVKYKYFQNTIIQYCFFGESIAYYNECDNSYKTAYYLDENNYIYKTEYFFELDTVNYSRDEIEDLKRFLSKTTEENKNSISLFIGYYQYSFAKMNKIFPVSKDFIKDIKYFESSFWELELSEIKKCIIK